MNSRTEFLSDIIITAIEGGIGYWSSVEFYKAEERTIVPLAADNVPPLHSASTMAVIQDTVDGGVYEIVPSIIEQGIARLTNGEVSYPDDARGRLIVADCDNWAGDIDSDVADDIVQAGLLGELRYA